MLKQAVEELVPTLGVRAACEMVGLPRASYYRTPALDTARPARPLPARSLSAEERATIRALLTSDRFADCAPREMYASLLDEGIYHCSWRTMYRILAEADEVRERRDQARRRVYAKPELLATAPNQLWSWDITKLKGPVEWTYYYVYVILDVFSRYVVGWMVMEAESAEVAEAFIAETCAKEGIAPGQLTLHADRGSAMTSKCVAQLLVDLQVRKSHSRPQVSNDNPFSESQCAPRHAAVDRSRRELEREGRFQGHPPQAEPKGRADRSMVGTRCRLRSVASCGAARPASYGKGWIASTLVPTRRNSAPARNTLAHERHQLPGLELVSLVPFG